MPRTMTIEKRPYSVRPWRLIDADGREIHSRRLVDPADPSRGTYDGSIGGATKAECIAEAFRLLQSFIDRECS